MIDKDKREEIVSALNARAPQLECPMCHEKSFTIVDGYVLFSLQEKTNRMTLGPSTFLPSVSIVCNKCGFISFHALGALELLPQEKTQSTNDALADSAAE